MSKGSSNSGDDSTREILNQILKALMTGKDNNYGSQSSYDDLKYRAQNQYSMRFNDKADDKSIKKLVTLIEQQNRSMNVKTTANFKQGDWKEAVDSLKNLAKIYNVNNDQMMKALLTLRNNVIANAKVTERRGYKSSTFQDVHGNENKDLKILLAEMRKSAGAVGAIDSAMSKVMEFVTGPQLKKTLAAVGADLIEGLEKSKWVGGALRDTSRLIGLLGASWMSQFGQLGKILGGAFYVAMELAGPTIVKLLLQGIGKLLMNLPSIIGKFGWGNVAGTAIGTAGAVWAFNEAGDSWKKGKKGNAVAFGAGGTGMAVGAGALGVAGLATAGAGVATAAGATGIAATLTGIAAALGPIGWGLIAIGAAVAGIAALWKNHSETIKKWASKFMSFVNKVIDFMAMFNPVFKGIQWIRDHWPWKDGDKGGSKDPVSSTVGIFGMGAKGANAELLKDKTDKSGHLDIKKMSAADWKEADNLEAKYDLSTGAITNLGKMTQRRAAEVIKADIEKKGNKSYYEIADKNLVDKSQFKTDVADAENVYLVRGTSARVKSELDKLQSLGYDTSKAKIKSGIGTLGSEEGMSLHTYADSATGHFGTTSTVDVGYIYKDGQRVEYKDYKKHLGKMAFGQSESDHDHWAFGKFQWMDDQKKAVAQQQSIAIQNAAEFVDPEAVKQAKLEKAQRSSTGDMTLTDTDYKKILKNQKLYQDKETNNWRRKTNEGIEELRSDSTGTLGWYKITTSMEGFSNKGIAGR